MLKTVPLTLLMATLIALIGLSHGGVFLSHAGVPPASAQPASCLLGTWLSDDPDAYGRVIGVSVPGAAGVTAVAQTGGSLTLTFGADGSWQARYDGYSATATIADATGGVTATITVNGGVLGTYETDGPRITARVAESSVTATRTVAVGRPIAGIVAGPVLSQDAPVSLPSELGSAGYACEGDRLTLIAAPPAWAFLPFGYSRVAGSTAPSPPATTGAPASQTAPAAAAGVAADPCAGGPSVIGVVVVPENTACRMDGREIAGIVQVRPGATLLMSSMHLAGTLRTERAATIVIDRSELAGTLTVTGGSEVTISNTKIPGRVEITGADRVTLNSNETSGLVRISAASVQCEGNSVTGVISGCP